MTDIRIWRASTKVSAETVRQYGELSGDDNAIHTDPAACAVDPVEAIRHRRRDRRLRTKE